jgi:hypothetical protein
MNRHCRYQADPADPAIRVCLPHAPDLGLYGDEECSGPRPGGPRDRWVTCDVYVIGPYTQDRAERELHGVEWLAGQAGSLGCHEKHEIVISDTKPPVRQPTPWPEPSR